MKFHHFNKIERISGATANNQANLGRDESEFYRIVRVNLL